jgi:hypothetical protein
MGEWMDTEKRTIIVSVSIFFWLLLFLSACASPAVKSTESSPSFSPILSFTPTETPNLPQPALPPTSTPSCVANLSFVEDVTIPDDSVVTPTSELDKQWLVQNSGTCNWDVNYRLRLISGDAMSAAAEQSLYPARAGTQATIRITFIAPTIPGDYVSEWQAFDAQGIAFGDSFFMKIVVSP